MLFRSKVVGVPEKIDFDPAHLEGLRAPKVAADEWGGFVWVNMAGDAATPLREWIGARSDAGRLPMKGFPKNNKFGG